MRPKLAIAPTTNTPTISIQNPLSFSATKVSVKMMSMILPMPYGTLMVIPDETIRHTTDAPTVHFSGLANCNSRPKSERLGILLAAFGATTVFVNFVTSEAYLRQTDCKEAVGPNFAYLPNKVL